VTPAPRGGGRPRRAWLTRGVASVGAASFFSDSGHEIATALLPAFLTSTLRASAGVLGLIEGVSDALIGVAKLVSGPLANDGRRRVRLARGGYLVTALATGALGLAATVWQAGALRATAWLARGARSPARDAMLASLATPATYGRAFGVERAGDNLGAVVGPLLAAALVSTLGVRQTIWLAAVPGALAALAITVAAREAAARATPAARRARFELRALRAAGIVRPLVPVALFELGNIATTLLILRATRLLEATGRGATSAVALAVVLYAGHNACAAVTAYAGGHWADRAGPRIVFAAAAAAYVPAYAAFALPLGGWPPIAGAFLLAGLGIGLAETAESTLVAQLLPDHVRGSGFGLLGGIQAFGDFGSTTLAGLLWSAVAPALAFGVAGGWMVLSLGAIVGTAAHR
jgi:MFS family permease